MSAWRTWIACALVGCCLLGTAQAQDTEAAWVTEMPPLLCFTQQTQSETVGKTVYVRCTYPETANTDVDAQMRELVDSLAQKHRDELPERSGDSPTYLEVGAVISRTGTSWMSFLTLAEISHDREPFSVDYDARVYDMETGERVLLTDVFEPESEAWALLAQEVRTQLSAAFPEEDADEAALDALCGDALREAAFTLGPVSLTLTYRADAIYPDKQTLLHVRVPYTRIRPYMTQTAQAQTDNSGYRMIALTYDDGGARGYTRKLLDVLRQYGAKATFFVVGKQIAHNHDILGRQQNAGYSIQSHTYTHDYPQDITLETALADKERLETELSRVIGVVPTLMRAPGGMEKFYVSNAFGYPLIHWSVTGADSGENDRIDSIAKRVTEGVKDGDIVLMHDTNKLCSKYTNKILETLSKRGYMFVTVEELFEREGVEPEADHVYMRPDEEKEI